MSVNGSVKSCICFRCSQCEEEVYTCANCDEHFGDEDFISCGDDGKHICEQCYEDFGPKAYSEESK